MYALASLGLRRFCVAGVGQSALQRGWMYALASLGLRLFAWQAWDNVHCQGVGCTPWRPWVSASFASQAWANVHGRHGTMCTARGSDVRPGVPGSPSLLRGRRGTICTAKGLDVRPGVPGSPPFCVAGLGQCALQRGWMYALAPLDLHLFCVAGVGQCAHTDTHSSLTYSLIHSLTHSHHSLIPFFAWQAWGNLQCQGPPPPGAPRSHRVSHTGINLTSLKPS